jgi:hypothetical protein
MSSHDARYEDAPAYDESGTTTTRSEDTSVNPFARDDKKDDSIDSSDRDSSITNDGPVLLPVDAGPEPTTDGRDTAADTPPVTIVDADDEKTDTEKPEGLKHGFGHSSESTTDSFGDDTTVKSDDTDLVGGKVDDPATSEVGVGPDTETGALKDPVPAGSFGTDETTAVAATSADPATSSATGTGSTPAAVGSTTSPEVDWRELQGRFVDDPQAAVKEAGALVEKALNDLRSRSEGGSTEDLRTAFRRYRDLYSGLN